jgi:hypothetical protein
MKKLILGLLAGVVAVGASLYLAVWRPLFALPETLPRVEQALATPDLMVLAGLNAKQAVFLERWLMDTPAASPPSASPAIGDRTLLDHLRAGHADPRRDLDYVLYGLYPNPSSGPRQAIAFIGRFDPAAVGAYLEGELHAKRLSVAGHSSYEVTLTDSTSCKVASTWLVTAEPGWILVADPAVHASLVSRLTGAPAAGGAEIGWWHDLSGTDLVSLANRRPDGLKSFAPVPFLEPAAEAAAPQIAAFDHAYLGLGISAVPPQGELRLVLDAKDPARAAEQIKTWQRAVVESRDRWAGTMPSVARLFDGLAIRTEGARSTVNVTVDRATAARLQDVGNELVASIFSGFSMQANAQPSGAGAGAERLETDPPKFEPTAAISTLKLYDSSAQFAEKVDQRSGLFGLRLHAIRLGPRPGDGPEVVVEGFAGAIPNLAASPDRATLVIDNVTSATGQELMKREECGRERNSLPASFTSALPPQLKASKIVHLIAGADAHTLQRIAGHITLRLPTRIEAVRIADPKAGAVVEKYGARVSINQVAGGSLSYQITGASDRVVLIRALNAKGQQLASSMKISGDLFLGGGLAARTDYSGTIGALEVIFAAEGQSAEFPFVLTNFSLAGEARSLARDETPAFAPYSHQVLRQDLSTAVPGRPAAWKPLPPPQKPQAHLASAQIEPFELSLDKVQPFFLLKLDFSLRAPDAATFRRRFDVGQLQLTRVALKDGSVVTPPASGATSSTGQADRSVWSVPVRFMSTPAQGVLAMSPSFLIDSKAKVQDLRSVEGTLVLQFPKTLETLRLDDLTVGQTFRSGDLTVTVAARSRQSLVLHANQDGERVVYVRLLDAQGQALMFSGPEIAALPDGGTRIDLSPFNAPARAEIVFATEMETEKLPFTLSLQ